MNYPNNEDSAKISKIVQAFFKKFPPRFGNVQPLDVILSLGACHANGCPLQLDKMVEIAEGDNLVDIAHLSHDLYGIHSHTDRYTGQLSSRFLPRLADGGGL